MKKAVIVVAGGSGSRMNAAIPKQFLLLNGKPVLIHTLEKFALFDATMQVVLVLPENEFGRWEELKRQFGSGGFDVQLAKGGTTRFESVKNGLALVTADVVGVHDAVRPLVSIETIARAFGAAVSHGSGIPAVPLTDSIRRVEGDTSLAASREAFRLVQTPQCFRSDVLKNAYQQVFRPHFTDDASVVEASGKSITLTEGNKENIKLTTPSDMVVAEALMKMNQ
ncbi:MAG: 2-C-methyl-D-erythritol 4-phosphate cytidylyltransferase [Bacteroidetes bacterium]|nr:2-C-methyl-D-erythritol 4-phosphate cytidylyltransferase [Bacteroidota bacterium]